MIRIAKNSNSIPSVLQTALGKLNTSIPNKKISAPRVASINKTFSKLPLRIAKARKNLKSHGAGVYSDGGDIWYREGEYLVKKDIDINQIVEDYISSCKA